MAVNFITRWVLLTLFVLVLIYMHASYTGRLEEKAKAQALRWRIVDDARRLKPELTPFDNMPVSDEVFNVPNANSKYTRAIVVSRTSEEEILWITESLHADKSLEKYIFVVDQPQQSAWKVPANKGHEAMPYLTYIIQRYDSLPDVSIFLHHHRKTWHNNDLLALDASLQIQRLNSAKVVRDGYMNLRCHVDPGCSKPLRPGTATPDPERPEEEHLADVWPVLFPGQPIPKVVRQPCCGQFAASRDRIRSIPKARYLAMQRWLMDTRLDDATAGRIFEYAWQNMFARKAEFCPAEHLCYCDGYGICFGGEAEYKDWYARKLEYHSVEYGFWQIGRDKERGDTDWLESAPAVELRTKMYDILGELKGQWADAIERGNDPRSRAVECKRKWRPGDGY